jgi:2,3-bisphosphoglycerate-dependent phosphoglycerate mutase
MARLVLVRHGKSQWNLENRFTGWVDVDLAEQGVNEAKRAGEMLKRDGFNFDICFSSYLKRAIKTAWNILEVMEIAHIDHIKHWKLNERHYGALTGLNKDEVKAEVGDEKFLLYRRSYDIPPPALSLDDERHPRFDKKYEGWDINELPATESLKDNQKRTVEYFYDKIAPLLTEGKDVLITAHGNTIRGLVKTLDNISDVDIPKFEIATATPRVYEFDKDLTILKKYDITE